MSEGFRVFDHTADIGIEVWGGDLRELFANAARALFEVMIDPSGVEPTESDAVEADAEAVDLLMKAWLSELLYRFAAEGRVYAGFEIDSVSETSIRARALGEAFQDAKHRLRTDIKAVTYHQLSVRRDDARWSARVILDV